MSNQNNKIIIISISLLFLVVILSALFVCSSSGCQIGVKQPGNNAPRNMQMDKPMGMPAGKEMDKPKGIILVNGE